MIATIRNIGAKRMRSRAGIYDPDYDDDTRLMMSWYRITDNWSILYDKYFHLKQSDQQRKQYLFVHMDMWDTAIELAYKVGSRD